MKAGGYLPLGFSNLPFDTASAVLRLSRHRFSSYLTGGFLGGTGRGSTPGATDAKRPAAVIEVSQIYKHTYREQVRTFESAVMCF